MRIPILHRHAASGQGFVRVSGQRPVYFGKWPATCKTAPPEVDRAYKEWLAVWLRENAPETRQAPVKTPSVMELWIAYYEHCRRYYQKHGAETSEVRVILRACRIAARLFGALAAHRFGAEELLRCRDEMIRMGWTRESINKQVARIRSMFRWGARIEQGRMVPREVYAELSEVKGLLAGRCGVPDGPGREAVDTALVQATLPHLAPAVAGMVQVQYLIAGRCQDVVSMRPCDIDRQADPVDGLWLYTPATSKVEHHATGNARQRKAAKLGYWLGRAAQEILLPLILKAGGDDSEQWIFPCRKFGGGLGCYTSASYARHIALACKAAGLAHWTPYQLRHTRMTEVGEQLGTEKAQRFVGHKHLSTAEIYAAKTKEEARRITLAMEQSNGPTGPDRATG